MKRGDVVGMTSCTVKDGGMTLTFRPPIGAKRGSRMMFLFLGNAGPDDDFDPIAALKALGWQEAPPSKNKHSTSS